MMAIAKVDTLVGTGLKNNVQYIIRRYKVCTVSYRFIVSCRNVKVQLSAAEHIWPCVGWCYARVWGSDGSSF